MRVRGEVFSGVLRGTPLIEKYYPRLVGLLGFHPFKGTMDVKLERNLDIGPFSTKTLEHILLDGKRKINAYLAPVKIRKFATVYKLMEIRAKEKEIIENLEKLENTAEEKFAIKPAQDIDEVFYDCWAIRFKNGIYGNDILELVAKDSLKEKLGIDDGDQLEIEFVETKSENPARRRKIRF